MADCLYRRQATYWWRRRIPQPIAKKLRWRETRVSLRTHVRRDAALRAACLRRVTDLAFGQMERALVHGVSLTRERMEALLRDVVAAELDRAELAAAMAPPRSEAEVAEAIQALAAEKAGLQRSLALRRHEVARPHLEAALAGAGLALDPETPDYRLLLRHTLVSLAQACDIKIARERGVYEPGPAPSHPVADFAAVVPATPVTLCPTSAALGPRAPEETVGPRESAAASPLGSVPAPTAPGADAAPTAAVGTAPATPASGTRGEAGPSVDSPPAPPKNAFSSVAAAYKAEQLAENPRWAPRANGRDCDMARDFDTAVRLFLEALGDRPVDSYAKEEIKTGYRGALMRLPRTHGKSARDRRTLPEIVADEDRAEAERLADLDEQLEVGAIDEKTFRKRAETRLVQRLGGVTVNKHLRCIARVFEHALDADLLKGRNPVKGLTLCKAAVREHDRLRPDTRRLPWGADGRRRLFGSPLYTSGRAGFAEPLFTAPLIAVLSGMRQEEVLQLQLDDIRTEDGVAIFDINDGPARSVKSESAVRWVPIHRLLIEAGFLEHVARLRADGEEWLFPSLRPGKANGRFSDLFTKSFTRFRMCEGIYDVQRDFHSLRKDANVLMREAGVPWAGRARILGHKIETLTDGVYDPEGESLKTRKAYVDTIDPGFAVASHGAGLAIVWAGHRSDDEMAA